jgi:hypothetical protein
MRSVRVEALPIAGRLLVRNRLRRVVVKVRRRETSPLHVGKSCRDLAAARTQSGSRSRVLGMHGALLPLPREPSSTTTHLVTPGPQDPRSHHIHWLATWNTGITLPANNLLSCVCRPWALVLPNHHGASAGLLRWANMVHSRTRACHANICITAVSPSPSSRSLPVQ